MDNMEPHNTHDFKHLYSGIYPDGSKIATKLCENCGLVELCIVRSGEMIDNYFYLGQVQINEIAYALLKGNNRFAHIIENRAMDLVPGVATSAPEDLLPPTTTRLGI